MMKSLNRRRLLSILAASGVGSAVFQRALAAQVERAQDVSAEMVANAEWISGIELDDEQRQGTARSLRRALAEFQELRDVEIGYDVPSCITFDPAPWKRPSVQAVQRNQARLRESRTPVRPPTDDALAFLPVTELAGLIRQGQLTSMELTTLYLDRLRRFDSKLKCVVTLTESLALKQAAQADREIAAGQYRGPLHGIPWGAKDLIAYPGYPTTWGAPPFRGQQLDVKATVARRLEEAGAVLVAKLSLGALAQGDKWFGGMTRNPWNPKEGSSGSSAGSASAVVAGLVGFAIGSETLGSIVSPCRRCGATGLRPTFGRVSRHGCMALTWSMDKLGPIARGVEDLAIVLDAIHGFDGQDASAVDEPFNWPAKREIADLRVGYIRTETPDDEREDLMTLRELGVRLKPIELPSKYPVWPVTLMLGTEAGTVFDPLTRDGVTEGLNSWPNTFRRAQFVPAVEYLRASRVRTLLMQEMRRLMESVDLYVNGDDLGITNLTGHPTVVLPSGFVDEAGRQRPVSTTFTGRLYGEAALLSVAAAFEQARSAHLTHPTLS